MTANVKRFPKSKVRGMEETDEWRKKETALFMYGETGKGKFVVIELGDLDEEKFKRTLVANSVRTVVDLRTPAVFYRPRFVHKQVISYLFSNNIRYVEYGMALVGKRGSGQWAALEGEVERALEEGLILVIGDAAAKEEGVIQEFRQWLRRMKGTQAELNPRALR